MTTKKYTNKWQILFIIILMYLPVSLDATILHVAAPSLSKDLRASSNEVLWIIDIYSLIMACFLLPMGVVGDKYGVKLLSVAGTLIFGLASFMAFMSESAYALIVSRGLLALGAAMILPATLSALRLSFADNRERAIALGIWSAIGTGGAALGPLIGGVLLEHYSWQSVFFINIPVCLLVLFFAIRMNIPVEKNTDKKINIYDPVLLIFSILLIILFFKSTVKEGVSAYIAAMLVCGIVAGGIFLKRQLRSEQPMIDLTLFRNRVILGGILLALTSMISLVGFEFFVSQELQLAMGLSPLEAGIFLLPLILASCLSGPCVGWAIDFTGVRAIAFTGVFISALCFAALSVTDFSRDVWQAWGIMICLGFSIEAALLASTTAIMNAAPAEKAGEAGAIEGMAYELGAGIGVVLFGLMMSATYTKNLSKVIDSDLAHVATDSLADTLSFADTQGGQQGKALADMAKNAFIESHFNIMISACIVLLILSLLVGHLMRENTK